MRVLHLGFEDHRRPGSGGGSLRNHEVNRRLADRHDIHVVCAAYPGCQARVEDDVRYSHVGLATDRRSGLLSYFAALPRLVVGTARQHDVVVEEFAGPWASMGVGHWTRVPTVGVVQWYFPEDKAREYHLPVPLVRALAAWGSRSHDELIAVSEDLAEQLRAVAPRSQVTVAGLGVDLVEVDRYLSPAPARRPGLLVYMGRLDVVQKGIDTLLDLVVELRHDRSDIRLVIAGDGHEAHTVQQMVRDRGLEDVVELTGRVSGRAKWQLLASAQLVVMPSRYETFGYVALEAMAARTPVVAFSIAGLRETLRQGGGLLVADRDTREYAGQVRAVLADPELALRLGQQGRQVAEASGWDLIARRQERVYDRAVGGPA